MYFFYFVKVYFWHLCNFYITSFQFKNFEQIYIFAEPFAGTWLSKLPLSGRVFKAMNTLPPAFVLLQRLWLTLPHDPKELLLILFNHVANFLSAESGWQFDFVQSLSISLCPFQPTIGAGSFIEKRWSLIFRIRMMIIASCGVSCDIYIEWISTLTDCTTTRNTLTN